MILQSFLKMPSFWGEVLYISTRSIFQPVILFSFIRICIYSYFPHLYLKALPNACFQRQINILAFMHDPAFNKLCPFIQDAVVFHTLLNKQSMQVNSWLHYTFWSHSNIPFPSSFHSIKAVNQRLNLAFSLGPSHC